MNMTTIAATITQVELMPTVKGSLPLDAASNVSAIADAGSASAASRPSGSARLEGKVLLGGCRLECRTAGPGCVCPRVEDRGGRFRHPVERFDGWRNGRARLLPAGYALGARSVLSGSGA